jgi:putative ABC transport system permease protein
MAVSKTPRPHRLMRPYTLGYLYRRRLRVHGMQELLAGAGIAVAVALVVATTVAEGSIAGSTDKVVRAVVGPATLQLRARGGMGFNESTVAQVEHLRGVKQSAPLLEQTATIVGQRGRQVTVDVAGTDVSLAILDGLARVLPISALAPGGVGLTEATAAEIGITAANAQRGTVIFKVRGRAQRLKVSAVLGPEAAGALANALVAVMPLARLQQLAGLRGRVSRILVQAQPGREMEVRRELERLAAGHITVAPALQDVAVLRQALRPSDQASTFFAAVSAVLGLLFAFTAMLLTVPERRRAIADLRLVGTSRRAIAQMVIFQALCLGLAASLVGVLAGYALSRWALHQSTGYLAEAFTLGSSTVTGVKPLLLVVAGGILATCLASVMPLLDLRRGRRLDAVYYEHGVPGNTLAKHIQLRSAIAAGCLIAVTLALVNTWPGVALPASALLALATVLAVPLVLAGVLRAGAALARHFQRLTALPVALASLRAATLRSLVLAATGAVAIFGSVALGGARQDLLRGIEGFARGYTADAALWVTNPDDNQAVVDFLPGNAAARIAGVPGVNSVAAFQGSFLDIGKRRLWIIARPPGAQREVLAGQVVRGSAVASVQRLGESGWVAVSQQTAEAMHTHVGGTLTLPTPSGSVKFRVVATTTNLAWSPGVIFVDTQDYSRYWQTTAPTAFGVQLTPGEDPAVVRHAVARALGPDSGLEVATAGARQGRIDMLTSEGLGRLGQISTLLVVAAILAMAAALASSLWQRRTSLAELRLSGVKPSRLRRILMLESLMMLGAGCLTGFVLGVFGELAIDGYLRKVTGFPVAGLAISRRPLEILAIVLAGALLLVAIPGWLASHVSPTVALDPE